MCGICAVFQQNNVDVSSKRAHIDSTNLSRRGPDAENQLSFDIHDVHAVFLGTTLHFRGSLTPQPIQNASKNLLLWNGEIFGGIEVSTEENDGLVLLNRLSDCTTDDEVLAVFSFIQGPWAAIFWNDSTKTLWFGRDVLGRRSLLYHMSASNELISNVSAHDKSAHDESANPDLFALSSVQIDGMYPWSEVPAYGMFRKRFLGDLLCRLDGENQLYPWLHFQPDAAQRVLPLRQSTIFSHTLRDHLTNVQITTNDEIIPLTSVNLGYNKYALTENGVMSNLKAINEEVPNIEDAAAKPPEIRGNPSSDILESLASEQQIVLADRLTELLGAAVRTRVLCQSGLCHACLRTAFQSTDGKLSKILQDSHVQNKSVGDCNEHEGDLLCPASFAGTAVGNWTCETELNSGILVADDWTFRCSNGEVSCPISGSQLVDGAPDLSALPNTVGVSLIGNCGSSATCGHARVAVLFSGGIDSLVIAALADRFVPPNEPIDLLNVAFEQQNSGGNARNSFKTCSACDFNVPDRVTGRHGLLELQTLNPKRTWHFVQIDVRLGELQEARCRHVSGLVYPHNTVLDDGIGCAVWFAARGGGHFVDQLGRTVPYTSNARVVLVGMGADEQLAGYSRHRTQFQLSGWAGLIKEVKLDVERISWRNLGRDDRVISDHSREPRFPFLDESVVNFLSSTPIQHKANLLLPRGLGEKYLLRLAAVRLGLRSGAVLPKRAIQFGSRIAKAENNKERASDVCSRLQSTQ